MKTLILTAIRCSFIFLLPPVAYAISAQWNLDPISGDWNTAANWTPNGVPNDPADIATFGLSNTTNVSISEDTEVNSIIFTPAATNPYSITVNPRVTLTLSDIGVTNNSGTTQSFVTRVGGAGNAGQIVLTNNATAGNSVFTNRGATEFGASGGATSFFSSSNAGSATITNNGAPGFGFGGSTFFLDSSTAGSATITNRGGITPKGNAGFTEFDANSSAGTATITNRASTNGGAGSGTTLSDTTSAGSATIINSGATESGATGGATSFYFSSSAGSATIINNGSTTGFVAAGSQTFFRSNSSAGSATIINNGGAVGGITFFLDSSIADNATLIANGGIGGGFGGEIIFEQGSNGGTSRVELFGNGILLITATSLTIGSIEGSGVVFLGVNNLTVGSNSLNTTFSGVIQDGGFT